MSSPLQPKPKDIYFLDHLPGSPARITIGRQGASVYNLDGQRIATLSARIMDRIVRTWADRQPVAPYHFLGAEAEQCV